MKKVIAALALVVILTSGLALTAMAQQQEIPVLIVGLPVQFDVHPLIKGNRTLVPFRAVADALNVAVHWDGAKHGKGWREHGLDADS